MFRVLGWVCAALLAVALAAVPGAAAASPGAGVPSGFLPSSTSWIDDHRGFVLGFAPCPAGQCPVLVRTADGGATWTRVRVPAVSLTSVDRRVRVHFANELEGLVTDGRKLYVTHTGGRLWRPIELPGDVGALASNAGTLYAIVSDDNRTRLFATPRGVDRWAAVAGIELPGASGSGTVVARGTGAYVALNVIHESIGYWATENGRVWRATEPPCPASANPELSLAGPTVFALCSYNPGRGFMFKDLLRSDSGGPFTLAGQAPEAGITTEFAAASASTVAIVAIGAGAAWLHRGTDGGKTWDSPLVIDEVPFADLGFTGELTGTVVWGGPLWGDARVYRTHDGGATWTPLIFAS